MVVSNKQYQAATFTVEMTFHTFLFAKPKDDDYSFKSFIIPLQTWRLDGKENGVTGTDFFLQAYVCYG